MNAKSLVIALVLPWTVYAWDGTKDDGGSISVESYDHGGRGEGDVEYYDYDAGKYRSGYLDMYPGGSGTITDDESGESFDVDMDR